MPDAQKRKYLIALVERLMAGEGTEAEQDEWIWELKQSVPDPGVTDLIYDPNQPELTAEQVVDQALAYKTIRLGPSSLKEKTEANNA